jgi:ABC-type glycerol-3-phosphate transport system substrate-binding protein
MRLRCLAAGLLLAACGCAETQVAVSESPLTPAEARVQIVASDATVTQILHKQCEKKVDVSTYPDERAIRRATAAAGGDVAQVVYMVNSYGTAIYHTVLWKCPEGLAF